MNLEKTRESLKKVFENKLSKAYAQVLKGEVNTNGDSYASIRKVEDVILEYLDCGGTIENGSAFEFAEKVLEKSGSGIKMLNVRDFLNIRDDVEGSLTYDEAVKRNSNLTLRELRKLLSKRYEAYMYSSRIDINKKLEYMSEFVQCGGIIGRDHISMEKINENPEYLKLYEEIQSKSKENEASRETEKSPLQQRESKLASLEAEEKTISEAEALIDKQTEKKGQNIGE